jgi:hypothetical protein
MTDLLCSPWATPADVPEEHVDLVSAAEWGNILLWASEILWALSGRQWSGGSEGCEAVAELRACPPAPGTRSWPFEGAGECCSWWPASGYPWHFGASYIRRSVRAFAVQLPHDEVVSVESVTVGGVAFTAWRLEGCWLERTDCRDWTQCGGLEVVVSYTWGRTPPGGGVRSVMTLAVEAAKQKAGDSTCRLPRRVISVTRQGVSMSLIDPMRFLKDGGTGLPDVDLWISSVNPRHRSSRASMWSPDLPRTTRTL